VKDNILGRYGER